MPVKDFITGRQSLPTKQQYVIYYTAFDGEVMYGEAFAASYIGEDNNFIKCNSSDCCFMIPPIGWDCE